jgi:hypothetical protein
VTLNQIELCYKEELALAENQHTERSDKKEKVACKKYSLSFQ